MGTLTLPTTGTLAGLTAVQDINAANAALATMSQGGTAPTPASTGLSSTAGLLWHDTTNNLLKLRNQADTTWITLGSVDEGNAGFVPYYEGVALPTFMRNYIAGLNLSNDTGVPNTKIDVSSGVCVDDTSAAMMNLGTTVIDCTTVGANGLDAGSLAAATWYHAFAICKAGGAAPALLASTSLASPTLPSGYTLKRRIGSFRTDASSHILAFSQFGGEFLWATATLDVNTGSLGITSSLFGLTVPTGIKVAARLRILINSASANVSTIITSPDESDQAPGNQADLTMQLANVPVTGTLLVRTDTSGRVRARASAASTSLMVNTYGWIDYRGRFS